MKDESNLERGLGQRQMELACLWALEKPFRLLALALF